MEEIVSSVPLFWDAKEAEQPQNITISTLKLTPIGSTTVTSHLYMLEGGSGRGSLWLDVFNTTWANVDFVKLFGRSTALLLPIHRGDEGSTPLNCTGPADALCAASLRDQWGVDGFNQFSETAAARDLAFLISTLSRPEVGSHFHIFAFSHGTYWAQRFLALSSSHLLRPETLTLDSVVSSTCSLLETDQQLDSVGRRLLTLCGADPWCSSLWGGLDPLVVTQRLFDSATNQTASFCLSRVPGASKPFDHLLQFILGTLITDSQFRQLIPATLYRLIRCNADDTQALQHLISMLPEPEEIYQFPDMPLQYNQLASELFQIDLNLPPPIDDARKAEENFFFSSHAIDNWLGKMLQWPKYPADQFWRTTPDFLSIPTLILNGDMDPSTPLAMATWLHRQISVVQKQADTVYLGVMPFSSHGTVMNSPVPDSPVPCALSALASFVTSPDHEPDLTCAAQILPPNWKGDTVELQEISKYVFGTPDMWQL
jgi:pimeloyl-ACP methyl ester carboxylesterase